MGDIQVHQETDTVLSYLGVGAGGTCTSHFPKVWGKTIVLLPHFLAKLENAEFLAWKPNIFDKIRCNGYVWNQMIFRFFLASFESLSPGSPHFPVHLQCLPAPSIPHTKLEPNFQVPSKSCPPISDILIRLWNYVNVCYFEHVLNHYAH